jgi:hypothetical protein
VPIVLADALLNLARRIDSGEVALVDAVLPESDKPAPSVLTEFESDDEKQILEEQTKEKRALAARRAEFQAISTKFQASRNTYLVIHKNATIACEQAQIIRENAITARKQSQAIRSNIVKG